MNKKFCEKVLLLKGKNFFKENSLLNEVCEFLKKNNYEIENKIYDDYKPYDFSFELDKFLNAHKEYIGVIGCNLDASVVEALMLCDVKKILINPYKITEDKLPINDSSINYLSIKEQYKKLDYHNIHSYDDDPMLRLFEPICNIFDSKNDEYNYEYNLKNEHYKITTTSNDYKEKLISFLKN